MKYVLRGGMALVIAGLGSGIAAVWTGDARWLVTAATLLLSGLVAAYVGFLFAEEP